MNKIEERIKELIVMGEFKTLDQAQELCRLHGLYLKPHQDVFQIAGALMDARKDQDRITRHACAERFMTLEIGYYRGALDAFRNTAKKAIINTKMV